MSDITIQLLLFLFVDYVKAWSIGKPTLAATAGARPKCPLRYKRRTGSATVSGTGSVRDCFKETVAACVIASAYAAWR